MRLDHLLSKEGRVGAALLFRCQGHLERFRWRCAWGRYPFPSRTRWSRPRRPMVLRRGRRGRAGGRRDNNKKRSRKGFKGPAGGHSEQAGHKAGRKSGPSPPKSIGGINRQPYLENRILTKREPNDGGDPIGHRAKRERTPGGGEECTHGCGARNRNPKEPDENPGRPAEAPR